MVRLETGASPLDYVSNISAHSITCRNGQSAFFTQPHTRHIGAFHVTDVRSYSCDSTLELDGGYEQDGMAAGFFSNESTFSNVLGVYGHHAQAFHHTDVGSCAPCATQTTHLNYKVAVTGIEARGYPQPSNRTACYYWVRWKGCPWSPFLPMKKVGTHSER